jgi:uncharacterized protein (TIGR03790 family)
MEKGMARKTTGCLRGAALALLVLAPVPAGALTPDEVLIVVNERSPLSVRLGEHYRRARGIPATQLVRLRTEPREEIDRRTYRREIEGPIGVRLVRNRLVDRVAAIVLIKGVPLKISGTGGQAATQASVDSELALLYRTLVSGSPPPEGRVANPYFRPDAPAPFRRADLDLYLVTRLDGFTEADVRALIDRGRTPGRVGTIVLDGGATSGSAPGEEWLRRASERLGESGLKVRFDGSSGAITGEEDVLGYAGWGSNDPAVRWRAPGFRWVPGAIASWFVSTSARTFAPPPPDWRVGGTPHAGSSQSLVGDLVAEGVTGTVGFVYEPYLDGTARPDVLFPAYRAGYTLAESFYMALRYLSWQSVVIGDPLVAPFGGQVGDRPDPPRDMVTYLGRRAAALEEALGRGANAGLRRTLALVHAERARELLEGRKLDEALEAATEAVRTRGEPAALYVLGLVHGARGEGAQARAAFEELVRRHPESRLAAQARRRLGAR